MRSVVKPRTGKGWYRPMRNLSEASISGSRVPAEGLTIVPYGETASLVVRYEGDGGSGREPILFSSHMDVVPADPESWLRHPSNSRKTTPFFMAAAFWTTSSMSPSSPPSSYG